MGQSASSTGGNRRRRDDYYNHTPQPQPPSPPPPPPAMMPPPQQPPPRQIGSTSSSASYPPLPPPPNRYYQQPCGYPYYSPHAGQSHYNPSYAPAPAPAPYFYAPMGPASRQIGGPAVVPPAPAPYFYAPMAPATRQIGGLAVVPPPLSGTKKVKSDVNLHKHTIKLVMDELNPDQYLVSFVFDASVDGSVAIYYFAKEGPNCSFSAVYSEIGTSASVPFQKGTAQKFLQPRGSGIDMGFFSLDELSKPSDDGVFPLVIYLDATPKSTRQPELPQQASTHAQITLAVIERNNEGAFLVKVVKQILWIDEVRYELQEIFGLVSSPEPEARNVEDDDQGKDCVICLSELRNTAVLPCRHMCMCRECANALRLQSNKCPICRQLIEQLIEINVNNTV